MGQKMHPMAFRRGVALRGKPTLRAGYSEHGSLMGPSCRWVSDTVERSGSWMTRDQAMRAQLTEWLRESGRMLNRCLMTRTMHVTEMYVDVYQLRDVTMVSGLYPSEGTEELEPKESTLAEGVVLSMDEWLDDKADSEEAGLIFVESREHRMSVHMEGGKPVHLTMAVLNELLPRETEDGGGESGPSGFAYHKDLSNLMDLCAQAPCAPALATGLGYRRSGGRQHAPVMRACQELLTKKPLQQREVMAEKGQFLTRDTRKREALHTPKVMQEESGFFGYRLVLKGRISGSERYRKVEEAAGARPRHTRSAGVDHGFGEAFSPSGLVSMHRSMCYA